MAEVQNKIKGMLENGQDPKEFLMEVCKPQCKALHNKLLRCELTLKSLSNADPNLSCMYPLRDWATCVDGCVNPKIHANLVGNESGFIS